MKESSIRAFSELLFVSTSDHIEFDFNSGIDLQGGNVLHVIVGAGQVYNSLVDSQFPSIVGVGTL
jgi:hypothetical protein